ncbi:MAG TPA: hypothetical protein VFE24_00970 [Pirellulales bacterium]|nr:hypothetical protein [Pirellulales bacterium]
MPIDANCNCGVKLRVKETLAGKRVRCPKCQSPVLIPQLPMADEIADWLLADDSKAADHNADDHHDARSAASTPQEVSGAARTAADSKPGLATTSLASNASAFAAPVTRRPLRYSAPEPPPQERRGFHLPRISFSEGWFGSTNSGMAGGILMMLIGGAWLGIGLAAGRIFPYAAVIIGIGVLSVLKGVAARIFGD